MILVINILAIVLKEVITMLSIFWSVLKGIFMVILPFLCIFLAVFVLFFLLCSIWFIIYLCKGKRLKKGTRVYIKKDGFFKKIFVKLPQRIIQDIFDKDPDFFKYQGLVIFEGRQGSGKTMSMVQYAMTMQKEYPKALCTTNLAYTKEDIELKDWRMLLKYKNGINGVIVCMDELQNWFSSNDSKNFPPEMLTLITQNRKNRRIILGTSQNFYLLAKAIRSQATEIRRCTTFFGALTLVRKFEPILDSEGNVKQYKRRGWYFFVHNNELRNSYDTFKVIERLSAVGFQDSPVAVENNTYNLITYKGK